VYEEAPGLRPDPCVMTRAQAHGDRVVLLSIVDFSLLNAGIWSHTPSTAYLVFGVCSSMW